MKIYQYILVIITLFAMCYGFTYVFDAVEGTIREVLAVIYGIICFIAGVFALVFLVIKLVDCP